MVSANNYGQCTDSSPSFSACFLLINHDLHQHPKRLSVQVYLELFHHTTLYFTLIDSLIDFTKSHALFATFLFLIRHETARRATALSRHSSGAFVSHSPKCRCVQGIFTTMHGIARHTAHFAPRILCELDSGYECRASPINGNLHIACHGTSTTTPPICHQRPKCSKHLARHQLRTWVFASINNLVILANTEVVFLDARQ